MKRCDTFKELELLMRSKYGIKQEDYTGWTKNFQFLWHEDRERKARLAATNQALGKSSPNQGHTDYERNS